MSQQYPRKPQKPVGEHDMDITTAIAKQLEGGRFAPEIDGDGAVIASLAGRVAHGSSSRQMVNGPDDPR